LLLAVALTLWGAGFSRLARADTSTSLDLARSVAVAGREAYNAGDYETALDLFRRAYGIHPVPTLSLYEARSLVRLGRLQEAAEAFERTATLQLDSSSPQQFAEAVASARQEQEALARRIPSLTVHVRGANEPDRDVRVTLNQRGLDQGRLGRRFPVDPGTYVLEAVANDGRRDRIEVALAEGRHIDAVLDVSSSSSAAPDAPRPGETKSDWRPTLAYTSLGLGVAGVGTGIVTGIMAGSKHAEATRLCLADNCDKGSRGADALDSFRVLRTTSTVAYGVGAAGLTAGIILWLSLPSSNSTQVSTLKPWFGARYAGIQGTFY
jgi:tetratricopeptide (TPR) repeat protein